jgi:hypothetical protein
LSVIGLIAKKPEASYLCFMRNLLELPAMILIKRLTLVIDDGRIKSAEQTLQWLVENPVAS